MDVAEIERLRKTAKKNITLCVVFTAVLLLIMSIICIYIDKSDLIVLGSFIAIIIICITYKSSTKQYITAYKNTFVLELLSSTFTNLVYEPDKGLSSDVIKYAGVMDMGDEFKSNDYISGHYKSIHFLQSDVNIKDGDDSTIFKGRWMVFDFNKQFISNVVVIQNGFSGAKLNYRYGKVLVEDSEFNNLVSVYATDEHDAFYILTPSLIERIKCLIDCVDGAFLLCFIDNKLHVGVSNNKDSFEPSINNEIVPKIEHIKISKDIRLITDMVNVLNLNNNLFSTDVQ